MNHELYDRYWVSLLTARGLIGRGNNGFIVDFFKRLCEILQCRLILEVGAHGAEFARDMAVRLPEATVAAFEANPYVHAAYAGKMPNEVDYRHRLVAADDRSRTLYIPRRSQSGGVSLEHNARNEISSLKIRAADVEYEEVVVDATTVDQVSADVDWLGPCGLWIDVEGASSEVLMGAHSSLNRNIEVMFIEVERRAAWVNQWLVGDVRDYLAMKGYLPICRDIETEWQFNELYVRSDRLSPQLLEALGDYIARLVGVQEVTLPAAAPTSA